MSAKRRTRNTPTNKRIPIMKSQLTIALTCLALAPCGWAITASEIIASVQKKYAELTSLSTSGKVVTDVDTSSMDLASIVPELDEDGRKAAQAQAQQRQTLTTDFTLRLARPDLYRVEWSQQIAPGQANQGAAWSAGDGFFLLVGEKSLMHQTDLDLGLASATGVSGGVAHTLPSMFFQRASSLAALLRNPVQLPDEAIGGENCHVVTGEAVGQKITLWVTREFLVKQKRHTLGGAVKFPSFGDDAQLKSTLEQAGQKATPEAIEQFKKTLDRAQKASSQMKGSITETYENVQVNQPLNREAFVHAIPSTVER